MSACIVIGDSLAVGVGIYRPECKTIAKIGINSSRYVATKLPSSGLNAETTVISLGVNDGATMNTLTNLRDIRARVSSKTVYWLLPAERDSIRSIIAEVAREHGDMVVDTKRFAGPDHIHPNGQGYQRIALETAGGAPGAEPAAPRSRAARHAERPAPLARG